MQLRKWDRPRLGEVVAIERQSNRCTIQWYDFVAAENPIISITHPFQARGWGIHIGLEIGTIVLVQYDMTDQPRIVAYMNVPEFYRGDTEDNIEIAADEFAYRIPQSGEIILQGKTNSAITLNEIGDVVLETVDGNSIEIDRNSQTIALESTQTSIINDAAIVTSGVVRRDIRTSVEKGEDILFGSAAVGKDFNVLDLTIGINPEHIPQLQEGQSTEAAGTQQADPDASFLKGIADATFVPLSRAKRTDEQTDEQIKEQVKELEAQKRLNNNLQMSNPAVTEHKIRFLELGDGNPGIDLVDTTQEQKKRGKLPDNLLGEFVVGTDVNEFGKILRFDYGFGSGDKGHEGRLWSTFSALLEGGIGEKKVVNTSTFGAVGNEITQIGTSNDRKLDPDNTLQKTKDERNNNSEWTVSRKEKVDLATLLRLTLHTQGADGKGVLETTNNPGSLFELQIDKQGLIKLNIPAATSLPNDIEPWRAGQSALVNLDGALSLGIGKFKETGIETKQPNKTAILGLDKITGRNSAAAFVTRNTLIAVDQNGKNGKLGFGRKDRSLSLDLAGNLEALIGADTNTGQSIMLEADGSLAFFFGKENESQFGKDENSESQTAAATITPGTGLAETRADRSITGRTAGSVQLDLGQDTAQQQSLVLRTAGGNAFKFGFDKSNKSITALCEGSIDLKINERSRPGVALAITIQKGDIKVLNQDGNITIESSGPITVKAPLITLDGNVAITGSLTVDGSVAVDGSVTVEESVTGGPNKVKLESHLHGGVLPGFNNTGPPTT